MKYIFLSLLFLNISAWGQKQTKEVIDAQNLKTIVLDSDEVSRISIKTASVHFITVRTETDGEYYNNISMDSHIEQGTLFLSSRFRDILRSGYDKLSAHKVLAMNITLEIPENMRIEVNSNVASVYMQGNYDDVVIQLNSGSSYLEDFKGDAVVKTYGGNIEIEAENVTIEAESRNGKVTVPLTAGGDHLLKLNSINGDIIVHKT